MSGVDLTLAALKFASVLVAGAFGVLALLVDYRDPATRKNTRWGKIALLGVVVSSVVGASSQVLDLIRSNRASKAAREQYAENLHQFSRLLLPLRPERLELGLSLPAGAYTVSSPRMLLLSGQSFDREQLAWSISAEVYFLKAAGPVGALPGSDLRDASFHFLAIGEDSPGAGSVGVDDSGTASLSFAYGIQKDHIWSSDLEVRSIPDLPGSIMVLELSVVNNHLNDVPLAELWSVLPLLKPDFLVIRLDTLQLIIPAVALVRLESLTSSVRYGFQFPSDLEQVLRLAE